MTNLLEPNAIARAESLGIKARSIVEGLRVGDHKSPYRGFSVEFIQHREYVPGDDIRHIDWKGYGRSERYLIKQYEQETNFTAQVLVDASKSMQYGEGEANKLEYAKVLACVLSFVVLRQRDSVALGVFDDDWRAQLPASSNLQHINTLTRTLEQVEPRDKSSIGPLLRQVADRVRRRGLVFLITDGFDDPQSLLDGIKHLRLRGHDVTLFHVLHPDEVHFPFDGNVRFEGLEEVEEFKTRPHLIKTAYLKAFNDWMTEVQSGCVGYRCDYAQMITTVPLEKSLADYLVRRLQMGRR